jgi:hypothetical protein
LVTTSTSPALARVEHTFHFGALGLTPDTLSLDTCSTPTALSIALSDQRLWI